jgi:hypothetical protein
MDHKIAHFQKTAKAGLQKGGSTASQISRKHVIYHVFVVISASVDLGVNDDNPFAHNGIHGDQWFFAVLQ